MENAPSLAIAATGVIAGLLIATGHVADVVTPLMLAMAGAFALRRASAGRRVDS